MRGRVKWFSNERGYGFITDERNEDHHFSVRDVVGPLLPHGGEPAEFDAGHGGRGAFARKVRVVGPAPVKARSSYVRDDRITCGYCQRQMVPRVIAYRGNVERTVCPFCSGIHQDFAPDFSISWSTVGWMLLGVGVVAIVFVVQL
jgi:cold shock protein